MKENLPIYLGGNMTKKPSKQDMHRALDALSEEQKSAISDYMLDFARVISPFLEGRKVKELAEKTILEGVPVMPQILMLDVLLQVCDKNFEIVMKEMAKNREDSLKFREPFTKYLSEDCPFRYGDMFQVKAKQDLH